MKSIHLATLLAALSAIFIARLSAQTTWLVNNVTNIGGFAVTQYGSPQVISTPFGNAVLFSGAPTNGLIISNNPIAGWTNFTIEMIFRPDPSTIATQPRIVHIQSFPNPPDDHLTLEGRITNNQWYADTFVETTNTAHSITLSNTNYFHPTGDWQDLAVTYDGSLFKNYVNGRQEVSGAVSVGALTNGTTSIGMRDTFADFFQGAVLSLRFTPSVLPTNQFMCIPKEIISGMTLTGGVANMDFTLTSGIPLGFNLAEAGSVSGPWSNSVGAVLTTNSPDVSYHFTTPATNTLRFYRVFWQ